MAIPRISGWRKFPVSLAELCIETTLRCGQSFRWRKVNDEWTCALHGRIFSLKQDTAFLHYKVTWPERRKEHGKAAEPEHHDDSEQLLRRYFSLDLELQSLYQQWAKADPNFQRRASQFMGVRILSQDAWEALIAFICSSNNNISRISQMVHKLCKHYGPLIAHVDGEAMHDFPSPGALTGKKVESHLRELGFGYRAKYIADTARIIAEEKPASWLESLGNPEVPGLNMEKAPAEQHACYKDAHEQLLTLSGVGPKVADCVCLMGLRWSNALPVDTHVWQIAQRDYKFGKSKAKTLNKAMYEAVGDHFRELWGKYAGWAHSVLFTADLREFSEQAAKKPTTQMVEVKEETVEEDVMGPGGRKRRHRVETEVKTEVTTKDSEGRVVVEIERSAKRRRTRVDRTRPV